ncbi:MAG: hypothetical protein JRI99_12755, partial [Deltaproteobacteria bacterium]|nr:hypothetical protein [Deltaproteobacteria bacterium]
MLINGFKNRIRYHRQSSPKSPHLHAGDHPAGGSKITATREIKVVRKVLDVNDAMAA